MATIRETIDHHKDELRALSEELWNNPELSMEEYKAHDLLANYFESKGFKIDRKYLGIDTAFRARFGSGSPNVCVCCEYDALPQIGHACGHNLIAEVGIATGLGLKAFLEQNIGKVSGTVTVMGTPAEEKIGGKVLLIEKGAFEDIDLAVMAHPAPLEIAMPKFVCSLSFEVVFKGKSAHAAAFPWEGVNALDAAVMAYNNISALRQQIKPTHRVHGVFKEGGAKSNIIPEHTVLDYIVRGDSVNEVMALKERVMNCFKGAAKATGCTMETDENERLYKDINSNAVLARLYTDHMKSLGIKNIEMIGDCIASTDMGNVSYEVPSIHPVYKVTESCGLHTREFTGVANTVEAHEKSLVVAKALVATCVDVLQDDTVLGNVREAFLKN